MMGIWNDFVIDFVVKGTDIEEIIRSMYNKQLPMISTEERGLA